MDFDDLSESDLKKLKCAVCCNFLSYFPIHVTAQNENICGRCVTLSEKALPMNETFQIVAKHVFFPCYYKDQGCDRKLRPKEVISHENRCTFKKEKCPTKDFSECIWEGTKSDVLKHCHEQHDDLFLKNKQFTLSFSTDNTTLKHSLLENNSILFVVVQEFVPAEHLLNFSIFHLENDDYFDELHCKIELETESRNLVAKCSTTSYQNQEPVKIYLNSLKSDKNQTNINVTGIIYLQKPMESRVLVENFHSSTAFLAQLACSICKKYILPPVFQYTEHESQKNVCQDCLTDNITRSKNVVLDRIANLVFYPCVNAKHGCDQFARPAEMQKHKQECFYQECECPFTAFTSLHCIWKGFHKTLKMHLLRAHTDLFILKSTLVTVKLRNCSQSETESMKTTSLIPVSTSTNCYNVSSSKLLHLESSAAHSSRPLFETTNATVVMSPSLRLPCTTTTCANSSNSNQMTTASTPCSSKQFTTFAHSNSTNSSFVQSAPTFSLCVAENNIKINNDVTQSTRFNSDIRSTKDSKTCRISKDYPKVPENTSNKLRSPGSSLASSASAPILTSPRFAEACAAANSPHSASASHIPIKKLLATPKNDFKFLCKDNNPTSFCISQSSIFSPQPLNGNTIKAPKLSQPCALDATKENSSVPAEVFAKFQENHIKKNTADIAKKQSELSFGNFVKNQGNLTDTSVPWTSPLCNTINHNINKVNTSVETCKNMSTSFDSNLKNGIPVKRKQTCSLFLEDAANSSLNTFLKSVVQRNSELSANNSAKILSEKSNSATDCATNALNSFSMFGSKNSPTNSTFKHSTTNNLTGPVFAPITGILSSVTTSNYKSENVNECIDHLSNSNQSTIALNTFGNNTSKNIFKSASFTAEICTNNVPKSENVSINSLVVKNSSQLPLEDLNNANNFGKQEPIEPTSVININQPVVGQFLKRQYYLRKFSNEVFIIAYGETIEKLIWSIQFIESSAEEFMFRLEIVDNKSVNKKFILQLPCTKFTNDLDIALNSSCSVWKKDVATFLTNDEISFKVDILNNF